MKNIKKSLAVALSVVMIAGALAGCGSKASEEKSEGAALKTGVGVVTSVAKSKAPAGAEAGLAEVDSLVAAVLVDKDGKLVDVKFDALQTKVNFDATGTITSDLKAAVKSKQELGEDYGMKKASKIGKEWFEQADAFAEYAKGKTVDEIKGIAVNEEGVPTDKDLSASVSIHIADFQKAIEKAVEMSTEAGAMEGDMLGLAASTSADGKSKNATATEAGQVQAYSFYSAVTTDKDGKITSCVVDASQGTVQFDATGAITTDLTAEVKTKDELKEEYGMKKASKIGKEWYEQAAAFAAYVVGKTGEEVTKIEMTDDGLAKDKDLVASVSVHISPLMEVVAKAAANAK